MMNRLLVWMTLVSVGGLFDLAACGGGADPGAGADAMRPGAQARRGSASVLIRVHYPASGHSVSIRGDDPALSWGQGRPAQWVSDQLWQFQLDHPAGPFHFKPLLDDQDWSRGANYQAAPGQTVDIYPHFYTAQGQWSRYWDSFHSYILNNDRGVWIYLPPSYDENPLARFPVLYMHDGQNLFDPGAAFGGNPWHVGDTMDAGAEALDDGASIPEAIVVGPENTANRIWEYTPTDGGYGGGGGDQYLAFLVQELKPQVDQHFRTRPDVNATALGGSSLGGLISAYAGLRDAQAFGRIMAMSPSTWWDNTYIIGQVAADGGKMPRPRVYVDSGDSGPDNDDVDNTRNLANTYRGAGYQDGVDFMYLVQPGGQHNETYWAERLPGALHFLLAGLRQ